MAPAICPNCGAVVPPKSRACPECGSDDETGWSSVAYAGQVDIPDSEFDYEEFTRREFGDGGPALRPASFFWWWVALGLVVVLVAALLF